MNHIVVIGFMGSGKTRVGKRLSSDLGLTFVDVDKVIVKKMNMSVKEILQKFGEPYYRALETMTVKALIEDKERKVISLGAGLPVQEQNEQYIKQLGKTENLLFGTCFPHLGTVFEAFLYLRSEEHTSELSHIL